MRARLDLGFPLPSTEDATPVPAFDLVRVLTALSESQAARDSAAEATPGAGSADWLAPADGAFSTAMAARLATWRQE